MESLADIVLSVIPWLEGVVDSVGVAITALPGLFAGLPIWLYGLIGAGFLVFADRYLRGERD